MFTGSYFPPSYFPRAYFTAGGAGVVGTSLLATAIVEVELAGAGAGWTNVVADVLADEGLHIRIGMAGGGPSDRVADSGIASFTLRNDVGNSAGLLGHYSPYHANKLTGWGLGIGCRFRFADPNTGLTHPWMVGRIDAIDPTPGVFLERRVRVTVVDWMDEAARWTLTPDIGEQVDKRGDQILTAILAEMPRQPTATSFDAGGESYAYALDTSTNTRQSALAEFSKLAASEFGYIYQKKDGTLRYEGRHARLLDTTSDWTLSDTELRGLTMPATRDDIINTVRVTVHPKTVDATPTTIVYTQANAIEVAGGGATKMLLGSYRDPVTGDTIGATEIQPLVAGVDYIARANADGTGAVLTSDFVIVVTAGAAGPRLSVTNNNASVGWLTVMQLRGKAIKDRGLVQLEGTPPATSSISTHGEHVVTFDMPYQDSTDVGQGAADYLLAKYSDPSANVHTATLMATTPSVLAQILTRDLSDRLTISEEMTGANDSFFINGIELQMLPSGHMEATYVLAPAADPFAGLFWILGTTTLGTGSIPAPF